ncbi:dTDP-4-dehydrorhamnose 3,5-epimerase family protein [Saccharomonospora glauca]|jgi:NDP-hexose 3,5-(Or5-) epimerase|uniref:dTDP-4-dehydrorhamnose 3,5-epimerase-like enzyme n=1 Tax=Saccharomonospora glauca K62 TaxID=928724 RepID=I1D1Y8_9PSEU|nr:dTDP-4-dehydrorhamnose 3,5-epimerase [Saccharomonospora glauca]EIE98962.1 dTDP-4-dehydrorhamnose 3,5-epimerase-like enzyme [Saccharomonospora glauca K62]
MTISEMSLLNTFRITPERHRDERGSFIEVVRSNALSEVIGYEFTVRQANCSLSVRNTIRGIHTTALPPGQAKLVTCVSGSILDVAVDLRVGSPTFGQYEITRQDADTGVSVYLPDGIGHAFIALTDNACVNYLCSEKYVPGTMIEIDPLDPDIGIPWNLTTEPVMSDKDAAAPSLKTAVARGMLPTYEQCLAHYEALRRRSAA